jgi:N-acetyl-gamma-glutamyl-phosphate reductase
MLSMSEHREHMTEQQHNDQRSKRPANVGIIGSAGYTGGELLRLLLAHPQVRIAFAHSTSSAGKALHEVHPDLLGETFDAPQALHESHASDAPRFVGGNVPELLTNTGAEVLFLCVGHGEARKFLAENEIPSSVCVIDLSHDFRYPSDDGSAIHDVSDANNTNNTNNTNNASNWLYGLPELNRDQLRGAARIANPGCFATCIQLGLLPLASAGALSEHVPVHTSAITGSTGAGQSLAATSHFSWRSNNVSIYKAFTHQHLREIRASLSQASASKNAPRINFIPYRGSFTRGILAASYVQSDLSAEQAMALYADYYATHPFVHLSAESPDVKQVVNTNKCVIAIERHDDSLLVISAIDNLLKGASGQAVQNMNLACGFSETAGLRLKAVAF